ncbi:MAG: ABC transporter permease [Gammaproteobacteria bacterium]
MWLTDFRYALRLLLKTPKFSAFCLIVLIGGLTISLFTFAVLYTVTYKPLTFDGGAEVYDVAVDGVHGLPAHEFQVAREELKGFSEIGVWRDKEVRLSQGSVGRTLSGVSAEWNIFDFARTQPAMGRGLQPQDAGVGAQPIAVISDRLWRTAFNADPAIIGRAIELNNTLVDVVGIMPAGFNFPVSADVWLPMSDAELAPPAAEETSIRAFVRVADGVSPAQARAELADLLSSLYRRNIQKYDKAREQVFTYLQTYPTMQMAKTGGVFAFFLINLLALFVLLLACINVGNLLLARAIERQRETAIRAALGAPRARLVSQLMWEGGLLTIIGGVISVVLVAFLLRVFNIVVQSRLAGQTPFWWVWELEMPTIVIAVLFTSLTLFLACFLPAWKAANQDMNNALRDGTRGAQSKRSGQLSGALVVMQVFLITTLMLIGSVSSYVVHVFTDFDTGLDLNRLVEARLELPEDKYVDDVQRRAFYQSLATRLQQAPSISDVHVRSYFRRSPTQIPDLEGVEPRLDVFGLIGSPIVQGIELREGRYIDQRDTETSQRTVVVSESFAKRYWPNQSALDQAIKVNVTGEVERFQIVGVVSDTINSGDIFGKPEKDDELYVSGTQYIRKHPKIYYKYLGDPEEAQEALYQAVFSLDSEARVRYVLAKEDELQQARGLLITTRNVTFFAALFSLGLAISGVYGLTANMVVRRTHEIGIRRAVGASDNAIVRLLLTEASRRLLIGLTLGVAVFGLLSFALASFTDGSVPMTLYVVITVVVTILLALVVGLSVLLPSRRSVRLEPSTALRYE